MRVGYGEFYHGNGQDPPEGVLMLGKRTPDDEVEVSEEEEADDRESTEPVAQGEAVAVAAGTLGVTCEAIHWSNLPNGSATPSLPRGWRVVVTYQRCNAGRLHPLDRIR